MPAGKKEGEEASHTTREFLTLCRHRNEPKHERRRGSSRFPGPEKEEDNKKGKGHFVDIVWRVYLN